MPPGLRLTRSHITTIKTSFNPFHQATSRPLLLLLNLLSTPSNTTNLPSPPTKASPSPNINVLVEILPKSSINGQVVVGYSDGKTETFVLELKTQNTVESILNTGKKGKKSYPKVMRKQDQVMTIGELVDKVDGWARVLKAKDEGA